MSKSEKKASGEAQGESDAVPVFDFFYYDTARVGSYIGQLDDSGHLQAIKQSEHSGRSRKPGASLKASVSLPSLGGPGQEGPEAGVTYSRDAQELAGEANERTYDPMWINACNFKDLLENEGRLIEDLTQANMGQFVLLKGTISILDAGGLKALWRNSQIQKRWITNAATQQAASGAIGTVDKKAGETAAGNTRLAFDLLAEMPHGIHCIIKTGSVEAWGPLRREGMVSAVGDVILIHGSEISGEWQMIGIMDARPNTQEELDAFAKVVTDVPAESLRRMVSGLGNLARKLLGRPAGVYGVTPLLIYREITGF